MGVKKDGTVNFSKAENRLGYRRAVHLNGWLGTLI